MANDATAYSHCPYCKKWVPAGLMNYDIDEETGMITRICTPCIEGTSDQNSYIKDEHFGQTQCIFCDSWNTTYVGNNQYKCNECEEVFVI